jgi:hypothetical protein
MADLNIYLIAKYIGIPKDPKQTAKAGYMKNPENVTYDEQVYIARGLKQKDLQNQVILNLTEQKIVKNIFNPGKTFEEAFTHYYEGYPEYIDDCVNQLNEALQIK